MVHNLGMIVVRNLGCVSGVASGVVVVCGFEDDGSVLSYLFSIDFD